MYSPYITFQLKLNKIYVKTILKKGIFKDNLFVIRDNNNIMVYKRSKVFINRKNIRLNLSELPFRKTSNFKSIRPNKSPFKTNF